LNLSAVVIDFLCSKEYVEVSDNFLLNRRPLDPEINEEQKATTTSLLSSITINTAAQQDDNMPTIIAQDRSSVSVESILDNAAVILSFHQINYSVGSPMEVNKRRLKCSFLQCFRSEERKQILLNISGRFSNGLNAILGKISFTVVFLK
jgi:hypothetical protein